MVQARLDDQWLEHAVDHYNNESEGLTLESHIGGFGEIPPEPTPDEQDALLAAAAPMLNEKAEGTPWWARLIAVHRELFDCVAIAREADAQEWWLFLYAKQSPKHQVTFLQLRLRAVEAAHESDEFVRINRQLYEYMPPLVRAEYEMDWPKGDEDFDIFIKHNCRVQGASVVTPHSPQLLEVYMAGRPLRQARQPHEPAARRPRGVPRTARGAILEEFDWLSAGDLEPTRQRTHQTHHSALARRARADAGPPLPRPVDGLLVDEEPAEEPAVEDFGDDALGPGDDDMEWRLGAILDIECIRWEEL